MILQERQQLSYILQVKIKYEWWKIFNYNNNEGENEEEENEEEENEGENDEENDGNPIIYVYIPLGVIIIILLAAILYLVVKRRKEKRISEITLEENVNYGRSGDFEQYYEEERNAKVVDKNDYYS